MLVKFEEIVNSIAPVSITLQIFGLRPYYITKNGKRYSFWRVCLTIFYITSYFVIQYTYHKYARENNIRKSNSQIINIVSTVYEVGTILIMLNIFGYAFLNITKDSRLFSQFYEIIQYMEVYNLSNNLNSLNNYMFRYSLRLVLVVVFGLFLFGDWLLVICIFKELLHSWTVAIIYWLYLLPNIVIVTTQINIATWLTSLNKLFEVINNATKNFMECERNRDCSVDVFLMNCLKTHKMLTKCIQEVKKWYTFQLFLFIIYNYVILLSNGYFILHHFIFQTEFYKNTRILIFFIKCFIQAIFNYSFITRHVVSLVNQVSILFKYLMNTFNSILCY